MDIKTDNDGFFSLWLGGEWEDGGYPHTQSFRLEWYKAGTAPGVITDINPWPNAFSFVDTNIGAGRDYRNKFVSDFLVNKWWTHTQNHVPSASPHDLEPVVFFDLDIIPNRVISNKVGYQMYQLSSTALTTPVDVSAARFYSEQASSWTSSGGMYYREVRHNFNNYYPIVHLSFF